MVIKLESLPNFRGFSRIKNKYGKEIKQDFIFRSESLDTASHGDIKVLKKAEIKTIIDFRMPSEIKNPDYQNILNCQYINTPPYAPSAALASSEGKSLDKFEKIFEKYSDKPHLILEDQMRSLVNKTEAIEVYRNFIRLLADKNNYPIIFHCRGGKDRAGYAAALLLLLLDVELEVIFDDYLLTNFVNTDRNEVKIKKYKEMYSNSHTYEIRKELIFAKREYLQASFDEMIKLSGSINNYLSDYLKVTEQTKQKIQDILLIK